MTKEVITHELKHALTDFLNKNRAAELVNTYLFYVEKKFQLDPVLYPKEKRIYQSADEIVKRLEQEGKLWHETEIKIGLHPPSVNEQTTKIYICPFTGKVFGDNTHPSPLDAIYDWVSKCPENTERVGGLKVKRFFISEDPEVIQGYIAKTKPKAPITKIVYSSVLNGKLFNSKAGVINDFKQNYLKHFSLMEVQNQNNYEIETHFLTFIQKHLAEDRITAFVEALADQEEFTPFVEQWLE
ncbi:MAG: DUF2709 domain-containing protein [Parachlamydiaceae bacterium]|nr:DUF2709 domain-containing protein [Parachlamydiaceae bacterium]